MASIYLEGKWKYFKLLLFFLWQVLQDLIRVNMSSLMFGQ